LSVDSGENDPGRALSFHLNSWSNNALDSAQVQNPNTRTKYPATARITLGKQVVLDKMMAVYDEFSRIRLAIHEPSPSTRASLSSAPVRKPLEQRQGGSIIPSFAGSRARLSTSAAGVSAPMAASFPFRRSDFPHLSILFLDGSYEAEERALIREFVRPSDAVLELGACLGIVSWRHKQDSR